eukprot:scaffold147135_cov23-Tisochrysis_lutea.AAC.1
MSTCSSHAHALLRICAALLSAIDCFNRGTYYPLHFSNSPHTDASTLFRSHTHLPWHGPSGYAPQQPPVLCAAGPLPTELTPELPHIP